MTKLMSNDKCAYIGLLIAILKLLVMKRFPAAILFISFFFSCNQANTTGELIVDEEGWIWLINNNLSEWTKIGSFEAIVRDSILTLSTEDENQNAMLITNDEYDNFQLEFDFRSDASETGVVFRLDDRLRTVPEGAGYAVSTDFNPDQQHPAGSIISTARATVLEDVQSEQWNTMNIEASGAHLKVFINRQLVAEVNDQKFSRGKIALQVPRTTGNSANFKNIRIQPLMVPAVVTELLEDRYRSDTTSSWESMFDDESLTGWSPIGDGTWEVENGAIHGYSGEEGGFLVSEKAYKDFYFKTRFQIIKEDNSGIFIRKSPDSADVTITDAIECNIYDHNGPSHAYSTGSIATHARAWFGMIDYEDWNEMEIFAENEHIVMFVNGRKSSESYLPSKFNKAGNICLQGGIKVFAPEQGPSDVYFREMMIKSFD